MNQRKTYCSKSGVGLKVPQEQGAGVGARGRCGVRETDMAAVGASGWGRVSARAVASCSSGREKEAQEYYALVGPLGSCD